MNERQLLDKAITCIVCALAFNEALEAGASATDLDNLRGHWVPDAEEIVDEAQRLGLWGDFDD
ncbi:MAG: hypothetical protein IH987_13550 [Planctomycetes bacterium]|nr:hypothetical protein [Planctomycetota bacterium]